MPPFSALYLHVQLHLKPEKTDIHNAAMQYYGRRPLPLPVSPHFGRKSAINPAFLLPIRPTYNLTLPIWCFALLSYVALHQWCLLLLFSVALHYRTTMFHTQLLYHNIVL